MNKGLLKGLTMTVAMIACQTFAGADEAVKVENAWIRDVPPHAEMSAAYLTIINHSDHPRTLEGATCPQFQKVEVHRTQMVNGQVRMRRTAQLTIAAHGRLAFKPGDYHLMLIHPLHGLKPGDKVELRLHFKDAPPLTVPAPVRESAAAPPAHHMHDMNM